MKSRVNLLSAQIIAQAHYNECVRWKLSSREIERKTRTDISYMYLVVMENTSYRTIARFKVDYSDLIYESFKTTIKIAKDNDLIKINHVRLDGTKIKSKTSINRLTDENQIKLMKKYLEKSIELNQQENEELCDESGNSIPESLTDKKNSKKQ